MPLTVVDQGLLGQYAQYTGFKNRIINPGMVIDQRNAGASVAFTASTGSLYTLDRWMGWLANGSTAAMTVQQVSDAPADFVNSLKVTVTAAQASVGASMYSMLWQKIEGLNVADLNWGTASARAVSISFWVKSSVTGTFGGAVLNSAQNRSYPFSFTINAANTWEQKTVSVAGDTSGTWAKDNGTGLILSFGIAMTTSYSGTAGSWSGSTFYTTTGQSNLFATNGSTLQLTGVQLEKGSTATSFDYRPYGTELQLCQRYFQSLNFASSQVIAMGVAYSSTAAAAGIRFLQDMRTTPTITLPAAGQTTGTISFLNAASYPSATGSNAVFYANSQGFRVEGTGYTGLNSSAAWLYPSGAVSILVSAEL